jgi:hypothetical protein
MRKSSWLTRTLIVSVVLQLPAVVRGKDRPFDAIVHRIASYYHKRPVRFMGLASFLANRARPEGVRNMKFAVFEDIDTSQNLPGGDFDSFLQDVAVPEFQPFVRVLSHRDGELTYVYVREAGNSCELLVVDFGRDEASVIQMEMKPEAMTDWFDEPAREARASAHDVERSP